MADGSDEPHVVDPMVALARAGADVVAASRYMRGGRQVGGPLLKRLMSRTAGLTLHWFAGVADPRSDQQFQALLPPVSRLDHDREHGRVRTGARADREGDAGRAAGRRGPDDVARPDRGQEQLQAAQVAAELPALVSAGGAGTLGPSLTVRRALILGGLSVAVVAAVFYAIDRLWLLPALNSHFGEELLAYQAGAQRLIATGSPYHASLVAGPIPNSSCVLPRRRFALRPCSW